jgi:hypothetical protein
MAYKQKNDSYQILDEFEIDRDEKKSPEKRLLVAILQRAIIDYLAPSKELGREPRTKLCFIDRREYWYGLVQEYKSSGLNQATFCRKKGILNASFHYWLNYARKRQMKSPTMKADEWFFRDNSDETMPFSFASVVYYLYDDPDVARDNIRRLLKKQKSLLEKNV